MRSWNEVNRYARPQECRNAQPRPVFARRPASELELRAAERRLLKDRDWIDEEEADLILAIREEKPHGLRGENIRDFARRQGHDLKD
jgi:hypothetical protein